MKTFSSAQWAAALALSFCAAASAFADKQADEPQSMPHEDSRPFVQYYRKMVADKEKYRLDNGALHISVERKNRPNTPLEGVIPVGEEMRNKHNGGMLRYQFGDEQVVGDVGHSDTVYIDVMPTKLALDSNVYWVKVDYAERHHGERSFKSSSFLIKKGETVSVKAGMFDEKTATSNATLTFNLE